MFATLFGPEMPLAARFFIAFLIVLILIGLTAWLLRRFGQNRLGGTGSSRGRQPRLAVIDAASVDGRRRLVLIRRDNVEHLIMIGGPTDVVVEQNIVRAASTAARDGARGTAPGESLPRAVPLGDAGWPLQPEPPVTAPYAQPAAPTPPPVSAAPISSAPMSASPLPAPPMSAPPLRATRSAPLDDQWTPPEPANGRARNTPDFDAPTTPAFEPAPETRTEPRLAMPPVEQAAPAQTDRNLAEMAQRLEAALRRPPDAKADPLNTPMPPARPRAPEPPRDAAKDAAKDTSKGAPSPSSFENLEQEMANLLGRTPGKT